MLGRFRSAVTTALDGLATITGQTPDGINANYPPSPDLSLKPKFTYGRPHFLKLSPDEVQASSDHSLRPILIPRNSTRIAWNAGYAEVVNAGKSKHNEDQAACHAFDIYVDVPSTSNVGNDDDRRRQALRQTANGVSSGAASSSSSSTTATHSKPASSLHPLNGVLDSHPSAVGVEGVATTATASAAESSSSSAAKSTSFGPIATPNSAGSNRRSPTDTFPSSSSASRGNNVVDNNGTVLSFTYFALFDGHAGTGCALWAANTLHYHVKEKLSEVAHLIAQLEESADGILTNGPTFPPFGGGGGGKKKKVRFESMNHVTADALIKGALEKAFVLMDQQIGMERHMWRITGGCTVVVALFFKSRLFIANAGDSRGIVVHGNQVTLSSKDFTPESERQRIQHLATLQPHLLGEEFTALQFPSRIAQKDVGKSILYRDFSMKGWAFKTAAEEDLKYPVVLGEGKRARVLATIGVTRGFGDYDLCAFDSNIHVKPFLTPAPEVFVYDLSAAANGTIDDDDVVVLATDGLWDVLSSQRVAQIIANSFVQSLGSPRQKYTMAAQEVVMQARGMQAVPVAAAASSSQQQQQRMAVTPRGWRMAGGQPASGDDISCFIIPLRPAADGGSNASSSAAVASVYAAAASAKTAIPPANGEDVLRSSSPLLIPSLSSSSFPKRTTTLMKPSSSSPSSSSFKTTTLETVSSSSCSNVGEGGSFSRANPELEELLVAIRKSSLPIVKGQLVEHVGGAGAGAGGGGEVGGGGGNSKDGKSISNLNDHDVGYSSKHDPPSLDSLGPPLVSHQPLQPGSSLDATVKTVSSSSSSISSSKSPVDPLPLSPSEVTKDVYDPARQQQQSLLRQQPQSDPVQGDEPKDYLRDLATGRSVTSEVDDVISDVFDDVISDFIDVTSVDTTAEVDSRLGASDAREIDALDSAFDRDIPMETETSVKTNLTTLTEARTKSSIDSIKNGSTNGLSPAKSGNEYVSPATTEKELFPQKIEVGKISPPVSKVAEVSLAKTDNEPLTVDEEYLRDETGPNPNIPNGVEDLATELEDGVDDLSTPGSLIAQTSAVSAQQGLA